MQLDSMALPGRNQDALPRWHWPEIESPPPRGFVLVFLKPGRGIGAGKGQSMRPVNAAVEPFSVF